jgi:hypothetical protein
MSIAGFVPMELQPAVRRESFRLELLIEDLLKREIARAPFDVDELEVRRDVAIAGGSFQLRIDRIDALEGGGYAILDYKSGEPRTPRWDADKFRDPQLLAYLVAERKRGVQALVNVALTRGRARFVGKASRTGLLPDVKGKERQQGTRRGDRRCLAGGSGAMAAKTWQTWRLLSRGPGDRAAGAGRVPQLPSDRAVSSRGTRSGRTAARRGRT